MMTSFCGSLCFWKQQKSLATSTLGVKEKQEQGYSLKESKPGANCNNSWQSLHHQGSTPHPTEVSKAESGRGARFSQEPRASGFIYNEEAGPRKAIHRWDFRSHQWSLGRSMVMRPGCGARKAVHGLTYG